MRKLRTTELNRFSVDEFRESRKVPITLILDNIRSMLNVGSAFRTADAFRIERILLCGITAKPPHREITKSALGATESVEWEYFSSAEEAIKNLPKVTRVIAIEQTDKSQDLTDLKPDWNSPYALVFGNEVDGVSNEALALSNDAIEIPQYGTKHSLNISVSIGVVLWHFISHYNFE